MGVVTIEGVVDHGQIRLKSDVHLPDKTKVYVVIPDMEIEQTAHVTSPKLAKPEQIKDFKMQVIEESSGADL